MNELIKTETINIFDFNVDLYGTVEAPLFIAADVAESLEYAEGKAHQMLELVDDDEKLLDTIYRSGQNREVWFLTENGLYEVLMQSRKPIAKQFKAAVKIALRKLRTNSYSGTKVNFNQNNVATIRNARIFFRNFEGREEKFNEAGNRNFHVEIDTDTARRLKADGWNVKTRAVDGEDETYSIKVKVNFDGRREPKITLVSGSNQVKLDRDSVKAIDTADIAKVDLTINGWEWEPGKISGYLATMYVTLNVDDLTAEYESAAKYVEQEGPEELPF